MSSGGGDLHSGGVYFALLLITGVGLAMTLPDDLPARIPAVDAFINVVAMLVPSIDKFVAVSHFPGVTRTFLAVFWALVPLMAYLNLRLGLITYQRGEVSTHVWAFLLGLCIFGFMVLAPAIWFDMGGIDPSESSRRAKPMFLVGKSRILLGAIGSLVCWLVSVGLSLLYRLLDNNLRFAWAKLRGH